MCSASLSRGTVGWTVMRECGITDPEVIKLFSCPTQQSTNFQLHLKTKNRQLKKYLALSISDVVFIMLIIVIMPTIFIMLINVKCQQLLAF